jgi:TatA/E family protein of Tat protein translocase
MFGIGMPELILILAVALIVIGPKKLPDLAKSLGKAMGEFKKATNEIKDSMQLDDGIREVKTTFNDLEKELKKPVETVSTEGTDVDGPTTSETSAGEGSGEVSTEASADLSGEGENAAIPDDAQAAAGPVEGAIEDKASDTVPGEADEYDLDAKDGRTSIS